MKTGAPAMTRIKAPRPGPRVAGVPRWIRWAAWASVLAPVPSGAWRLALAAGAPLGFSADRLRGIGVPGWASLYVVGLSVVSVGLACLALGLIRPWGEVFPQWVPALGGRNVPALAAVIPAGLAAVLLTAICVEGAAGWGNQFDVTGSPSGGAAALMTTVYAPMLAWGPLLGIVTVAYYIRRRNHSPTSRAGEIT